MTIAAGGADNESRDSRLTKDAKIAAGRCLKKSQLKLIDVHGARYTYEELRKSSVMRKNRALCFRCRTLRSKNAYRRV